MNTIGLVFSGGGGKGAYQIGVWKALRELGIEEKIIAASGTSVGALNAMLYLKGDLNFAERIWLSISNKKMLPINPGNTDSFFSNDGLDTLLNETLSKSDRRNPPLCYATCKRVSDGVLRRFELRGIIDSAYRKEILLATSAIPGVFPQIEIDGDAYVDGGANGDNTPVYPLLDQGIRIIIVVHLSLNARNTAMRFPDVELIDVFPSEDLGNFVSGTMDFSAKGAQKRMLLGYRDGIQILSGSLPRLIGDNTSPTVYTENMAQKRTPYNASKKKIEENATMETVKFEQDAMRRKYEERMAELSAIANSSEGEAKILWDKTVDRYYKTVEAVGRLLQQDELKNEITSATTRKMTAFLKKCAEPEYHIAMVGAIKAGKSTLINAMLGEELASTEVTPETAALTKFRSSRNADEIKITFYSSGEWEQLWESAQKTGNDSKFMEEFRSLNAEQEKGKWVNQKQMIITPDTREQLKEEIQRWTSSRSAEHYFVKEVEVSLKGLDLPDGVVFVDTPGLNDIVAYRSNITKDYIDRANAVFVCIKAEGLSGREISTISSVFANARFHPEKVYIVATQQDALNEPVDGWMKLRNNWIDVLKGAPYYGSVSLAEHNLVSTSAYLFTLLKECSSGNLGDRQWQLYSTAFKFHYMPDQISEHFDDLLDFTGVQQLKRQLSAEVLSKHQQLLQDDIKDGYYQLRDDIVEKMQTIRKNQEEIIRISSEKLETINKLAAEKQKEKEEMEKEVKELETLCAEIKKQTDNQKEQLTKAIRDLGGK